MVKDSYIAYDPTLLDFDKVCLKRLISKHPGESTREIAEHFFPQSAIDCLEQAGLISSDVADNDMITKSIDFPWERSAKAESNGH